MSFQFSIEFHVKVLLHEFFLGHGEAAMQGLIGGVLRLIYEILEPDLVSWNSIVAGLADNVSPHELQFVS